MIPIAQFYPQYPSTPHDDRSTRHKQVNGNFAGAYWCHATCSTVLRVKELSATGHPKLDCIHKRKKGRGKRRSSSCGKYSNKGRSRIVDCRIAPQLPRSAQHVAKAKRLLGAMALEPAASCVTGRRSNQLNYAPANSLKMTSRSLHSLAVSCTAFHVLRRDRASFST